MAKTKGLEAHIYVGTSSPPTEKVANVRNPDMGNTPQTDNTTTNDSAGPEHEVIRIDGELSFDVITDAADAGQIVLRAAARAGTKVYVDHREQGTLSGKPQDRFRASVQMRRRAPIDGMHASTVTLKLDGEITTTPQA